MNLLTFDVVFHFRHFSHRKTLTIIPRPKPNSNSLFFSSSYLCTSSNCRAHIMGPDSAHASAVVIRMLDNPRSRYVRWCFKRFAHCKASQKVAHFLRLKLTKNLAHIFLVATRLLNLQACQEVRAHKMCAVAIQVLCSRFWGARLASNDSITSSCLHRWQWWR